MVNDYNKHRHDKSLEQSIRCRRMLRLEFQFGEGEIGGMVQALHLQHVELQPPGPKGKMCYVMYDDLIDDAKLSNIGANDTPKAVNDSDGLAVFIGPATKPIMNKLLQLTGVTNQKWGSYSEQKWTQWTVELGARIDTILQREGRQWRFKARGKKKGPMAHLEAKTRMSALLATRTRLPAAAQLGVPIQPATASTTIMDVLTTTI